MLTLKDITNGAQQRQESRLKQIGEIALAAGGGKFKLDEFFNSVKRFERNVYKTDAKTICASTAFADQVLTHTNKADRWSMVAGIMVELYADTIIEAPVAGQIYRNMTVELKRANGTTVEQSLRALCPGFDNVQAEADVPLPNAGRVANILEFTRQDFESLPWDILNPSDVLTLTLKGLNGTTAAVSHNGAIHACAHLITVDGIKG